MLMHFIGDDCFKNQISCARKYLQKKKCIWKICLKKWNFPLPFLLFGPLAQLPRASPPLSWARPSWPVPLSPSPSQPLIGRARLSALSSSNCPRFPLFSLSAATAQPNAAPPPPLTRSPSSLRLGLSWRALEPSRFYRAHLLLFRPLSLAVLAAIAAAIHRTSSGRSEPSPPFSSRQWASPPSPHSPRPNPLHFRAS